MSASKEIRQLLENGTTAALGTLDSDQHPFVTLVSIAAAAPLSIVMLLSDLAKHAQFLAARPVASLLIADDRVSPAERMAAARVTLTGSVRRVLRSEDALLRQPFLAKHPQAAMYADFGDFSIYEFSVVEAHLVAGFGKIQTVPASQLAR
jgi:heme iron utilization protein